MRSRRCCWSRSISCSGRVRPAHAVVDVAVRTCARLGKASAKGLVNAVLRNFLRERDVAAGACPRYAARPLLLSAVVDRRAGARLSEHGSRPSWMRATCIRR